MWDFSLCLLTICLLLHFFFFLFFNYWLYIFRLKQLRLYVQQEEESFISEDKCSINTVAGIDQYEKDYKTYFAISAINDKCYHSHYKWGMVSLRFHGNLRN